MVCLVDEAGSLLLSDKSPFRVGFLLTCRPDQLESDIERLKRELPPRDKHGEYHASKDTSDTRAALRRLLSLNSEPQMYIVEWAKETFPEECFSNGKLQVFQDTNLLMGSFALAAAQIAAAASANRFSLIHVIAEAVKNDVASEHRSRAQAFGSVIETVLQKQSTIKAPPFGTQTVIKVSTRKKTDYSPLSFVDYWLWAYCRHTDQHDNEVLPLTLKNRTVAKRMVGGRLQT